MSLTLHRNPPYDKALLHELFDAWKLHANQIADHDLPDLMTDSESLIHMLHVLGSTEAANYLLKGLPSLMAGMGAMVSMGINIGVAYEREKVRRDGAQTKD